MSLSRLLVRAARRAPASPAVALGKDILLDYAGLASRAAILGANLRRRFALRPGDRVGLILRNCPQYPEILFACWHVGLVAVPVNARLAPAELAYILEHSGARVCFVAADTAASVSGTLCGLSDPPELVETDKSDYRVLCSGRPGAPDERAADDTAWLFYTSGTTGRPKGAMLSHRNLFTMTAGYFVDVDRVEPTDAILHAAPMSHGSGLYILPHVAAGAAQVVPESGGFDASEVFELSTQYPGATLFAPPTLVRRLVDHADAGAACPSGLKTVVCGGGPMYVADCRRALEVLGPRLAQIYGQGESPMTITSMAKAQFPSLQDRAADEILASVGFPQALVDVAVVDDEDRAVPRGEPGEVVVRGDCVMLGYWRDPAASADTLRGGWLHTGDIGVLGARGQLLLKDRSKDLIISGGSNIYPREVEEILLLHPAVLEASVVGRVHRDWGEEVVAFVVARPREPSLEDELDALCRAHIARFKRPRDYRFVSELPKNNYGKVLKTVLREAMS